MKNENKIIIWVTILTILIVVFLLYGCGGGSSAVINDECGAWEQKLLSCCVLWSDDTKTECLFAGSTSCEARVCPSGVETKDCTPCR